MEFESHLGKKLLLPGLLHREQREHREHREPTERELLNLPKGEMVFQGS